MPIYAFLDLETGTFYILEALIGGLQPAMKHCSIFMKQV